MSFPHGGSLLLPRANCNLPGGSPNPNNGQVFAAVLRSAFLLFLIRNLARSCPGPHRFSTWPHGQVVLRIRAGPAAAGRSREADRSVRPIRAGEYKIRRIPQGLSRQGIPLVGRIEFASAYHWASLRCSDSCHRTRQAETLRMLLFDVPGREPGEAVFTWATSGYRRWGRSDGEAAFGSRQGAKHS